MPIKFEEIRDAFDFVGAASDLGEHQAFLCTRSGKIYCHSDWSDLDDELPDDMQAPRLGLFHRRGAYAGFKSLLARRGVLEQWYDFEEKATVRALREWCELNSIALSD